MDSIFNGEGLWNCGMVKDLDVLVELGSKEINIES